MPTTNRNPLRGRAALGLMATLGALLLPASANANGWWEPAIITRISVDVSGNVYLMVTPSASAPGQTPPPCSANTGWQTVFSSTTPAGQAMLSMAIAAKMSKTPVRLIGNGTCSIHPAVEGTSYIDLLPS
jgi:hypothetical protein